MIGVEDDEGDMLALREGKRGRVDGLNMVEGREEGNLTGLTSKRFAQAASARKFRNHLTS
jgi:hypothetical protein